MFSASWIEIRGAATHHLRALDLNLPIGKMTVITGVSGSGKSTLACDTIHAEGQRRYLECLTPAARGLLASVSRPRFDSITGLPPTLSVSQVYRPAGSTSRTTVADATGIADLLRLLMARLGDVVCLRCQTPIARRSIEAILDTIEQLPQGERIHLLAPLVYQQQGDHRGVFEQVRRAGFLRLRIDGAIHNLDAGPALNPNQPHSIEMVVDRQVIRPGLRSRLAESVKTALKHGKGVIIIGRQSGDQWLDDVFGVSHACPRCGQSYREVEPRTFNPRSPHGACPECHGFGTKLANGSPTGPAAATEAPGANCPACHGTGLGPMARVVRLNGKSIAELGSMNLEMAARFVSQLTFSAERAVIAEPILKPLQQRFSFLERTGLGHLGLDRPVHSLSGGEFQRVRLAECVASGLSDIAYILDEPTVGLHPRDVERLLVVLAELRQAGNTLIVVDHDESIIRSADWLVDLGPGAGKEGGQIVNAGPLPKFLAGPGLTADYLTHEAAFAALPSSAANLGQQASSWIEVRGARWHNLTGFDVRFPVGRLTAVTGVSGSGKSTLVFDVLAHTVQQLLGSATADSTARGRVAGIDRINRVVVVDQTPPGTGARSIPATLLGILDPVREIFAQTRDGKLRGFSARRFSFNHAAGRCAACQGLGRLPLAFDFGSDAEALCAICQGRRFNRATLAVKYRGKSIADVLAMSVDEAAFFFAQHPRIAPALALLREVRLGYLRLDQSPATLSGGERQRIKLAAELAQPEAGAALFILDEPTTGLHFAEIGPLLGILRRLTEAGSTVIVVEHHGGFIQQTDWVVDLGPDSGANGGQLIYAGPTTDFLKHASSLTARYLRDWLEGKLRR